MFDKGDI